MSPVLPVTTMGALLLGLTTSLHCVGMCGPLACGLGSLAKSEGERLAAASLYHGCRLLSYGVIGAICGALGQQPLRWFFDSPAVLLPWVLVLLLASVALGVDKKIPRPAILVRWTSRLRFRVGRWSAIGGAMALGLMTPLLPCGPLYLVFAGALLAGTALRGAEFTMAFGLGTIPLLWLAQQQFQRFRAKLTPQTLGRLRRTLAFITVVVLVWRLHGTLPLTPVQPALDAPVGPEAPAPPGKPLPTCCPSHT